MLRLMTMALFLSTENLEHIKLKASSPVGSHAAFHLDSDSESQEIFPGPDVKIQHGGPVPEQEVSAATLYCLLALLSHLIPQNCPSFICDQHVDTLRWFC